MDNTSNDNSQYLWNIYYVHLPYKTFYKHYFNLIISDPHRFWVILPSFSQMGKLSLGRQARNPSVDVKSYVGGIGRRQQRHTQERPSKGTAPPQLLSTHSSNVHPLVPSFIFVLSKSLKMSSTKIPIPWLFYHVRI